MGAIQWRINPKLGPRHSSYCRPL